MPVKPVTDTLHLDIETPADMQRLFEEGVRIAKMPSGFPYLRQNAERDLEDYFFYLGAVHPEYLPPFHSQLFELADSDLAAFPFTFDTWLYVLQGTQDRYVDSLLKSLTQNPTHWIRQNMLAAICTPYALAVLGTFARAYALRETFEQLGFHIPATDDPAIPRFSVWRNAIKLSPFHGAQAELTSMDNPVGLSLAFVSDEASRQLIRWHYLSLKSALLPDFPTIGLPQLHLVSPQQDSGWTLYCEPQNDGRYRATRVVNDYAQDEELTDWLEEYANDDGDGLGTAELVPYDDRLIYSNGHVHQTGYVVGTAGGPPLAVYELPKCPSCGKVMFHIFTVVSYIRKYGEGFRSLFICEICKQIACRGTSWN